MSAFYSNQFPFIEHFRDPTIPIRNNTSDEINSCQNFKNYDDLVLIRWIWLEGFYQNESDENNNWRWAEAFGRINIQNNTNEDLELRYSFELGIPHNIPANISIKNNLEIKNFTVSDLRSQHVENIILTKGANYLAIKSDSPTVFKSDGRKLSYVIYNFKLISCRLHLLHKV